eukprot:GDKH01027933.1.p3 GENE.GDKH01027933.1~~GDKH01027933.1.p3  ORF type:complete len:58 (-),score=6.97 GDKH01027933.1:25-198(-)
MQLCSYGFVQQGCCHGTVHAPGYGHDHMFITNLFAHSGYGFLYKAGRGPVPFALADT